MNDTTVVANELHAAITDRGWIDIGDRADDLRLAVRDLRRAGHVVLVGVKFLQSDGRVSQVITFGQEQSAKAAVDL